MGGGEKKDEHLRESGKTKLHSFLLMGALYLRYRHIDRVPDSRWLLFLQRLVLEFVISGAVASYWTSGLVFLMSIVTFRRRGRSAKKGNNY